MKSVASNLAKLKPNVEWASLPLFDRTGWKRVRFGNVVENCAETCDPAEAGLDRFIAMEHLEPGSLHIRCWGNVADGTTFTRRCRPGQVLFGKRRAYQRKVAVAEFEAVVSGDIYVLAPKDTRRLLPELLPFLCLSERFFQHAVGTSAGSLSPRTNWSSLASFEFDLPPLDQQRRIAEILWAVDYAAQTEHRALIHAEDCRSSILAEYFPNDLTFADMRRLGRSGEKNFSTLKDVTRKITDGVHLTPNFSSQGVPFLLVSNLASGTMDWNIERWVTHETYLELTKTKKAEVGDVLYTVVASFGISVYMDWERPFCFQRHIALIKPNPELLLGRYLVLFLQSQMGKRQSEIYAEGNAQRTITLGSLAQFVLPVPSISAQTSFVHRVEEFTSAIEAQSKHLKATFALLSSLINSILPLQ